MKTFIKKITCLVIIAGLNWTGLAAIIDTFAYLNDSEEAALNSLNVGTLYFSLDGGDWTPAETAANLLPGDAVTKEIKVVKQGSLGFQYDVITEIIADSGGLCNELDVEAKLGDEVKYSGYLTDLNITPVVLSPGGEDNWIFTISLPGGAPELEGASCEFKFVFNAWQENLEKGMGGLTDIQETYNLLEAGNPTPTGFMPIADGYIDQVNPCQNHGSDGELAVKSKGPNSNKRTFVRFDFRFPVGTTILSSDWKMFMASAPTVSRDYEAKRVTERWEEESLSCDNEPAATASLTDIVPTGTSDNTWLSWNVASDVQDFVNETHPNYGWRLTDKEEDSAISQEAKFISRENSQVALRPVLEIAFSAPEATTDYPVINEIYYHVDPGSGGDPQNEWVEIYNPTNTAVNLSGWRICDNGDCDIIPTSAPIPSHGFAVIAGDASTWGNWTIPAGAIKIVLGSTIGGGGLANTGDRMLLRDPANAVIDAMSYGADDTQFLPAIPLSGLGKSLARVIKGYDTNSAADWIINVTPNPGANPSASSEADNGVEIMRFTDQGVEVASLTEGLEPLAAGEALPEEILPEAIEEPMVEGVSIGPAPIEEPVPPEASVEIPEIIEEVPVVEEQPLEEVLVIPPVPEQPIPNEILENEEVISEAVADSENADSAGEVVIEELPIAEEAVTETAPLSIEQEQALVAPVAIEKEVIEEAVPPEENNETSEPVEASEEPEAPVEPVVEAAAQ